METENQTLASGYHPQQPELQINAQMRNYLLQAAKWAKFLAIVGFIFLGLLVIGAFTFGSFMSSMMATFPGTSPRVPGGSSIFMTIYLLFCAVVYFFPTLYLYQFSSKIKTALLYGQELDLAFAFSRLKSCFKFWGILILIIFGFYALILIGVAIGAAFLR